MRSHEVAAQKLGQNRRETIHLSLLLTSEMTVERNSEWS